MFFGRQSLYIKLLFGNVLFFFYWEGKFSFCVNDPRYWPWQGLKKEKFFVPGFQHRISHITDLFGWLRLNRHEFKSETRIK